MYQDVNYTILGEILRKVLGKVAFPDQASFGTLHYSSRDSTMSIGTFNFTAIGLSGGFQWDSTSNYTGATSNNSFGFSANRICVQNAPEPSSFLLFGFGSLGLIVSVWRPRGRIDFEDSPV
jgi:hypothetical protein